MASREVQLEITGADRTARAVASAAKRMRKLQTDTKKVASGLVASIAEAAPGLAAALGKAGSAGGVAMMGAVAAAVVVAAPMVGAALAAGILLGVGGAALGAGIASAIRDPKVAAAFDEMKARASRVFEKFGEPFKGPLLRAAKTFGDAIERMGPAFGRIGQKIAPIIDKLAPALADMAERAMPGIERAVEAAVPLFEALADALPGIGDAAASFFDSIADAGPGAVLVFKLLLSTTTDLVVGIGEAIEFLAKSFHWVVRQILNATSMVLGAIVSVTGVAAKIPGPMQRAFQAAHNGAKGAKASVDGLKASLFAVPNKKTVTVVAQTGGAHSAIRQLQDALNAIVNRQYTAVLTGKLDYFGGKLDAAANWQRAQFAGAAGFNAGSGGGRTGGPVSVRSDIRVNLDGQPFRAMTAEAIGESERRQAWRSRVGKR